MNTIAYILYFLITYFITVHTGLSFYRNGRIYILNLLEGNEALTSYINRLLLVGYYLLNLGYVALTVNEWDEIRQSHRNAVDTGFQSRHHYAGARLHPLCEYGPDTFYQPQTTSDKPKTLIYGLFNGLSSPRLLHLSPLMLLLTWYVAGTLFKSGKTFMLEIFHNKEDIANATNKLFKTGFYLLNLGFGLVILEISRNLGRCKGE